VKKPGGFLNEFNGFDLVKLGVPLEARPLANKEYKGKKGYTVTSPTGAAIEVLVVAEAYVVKRCGTVAGGEGPEFSTLKSGQVTWSKFDGPAKAWEVAKKRAYFV
ncbi:30S ribosomal protein S6, partial [Durusdinium trenchii]